MNLFEFICNNKISYYNVTKDSELLINDPKKFINQTLIRGDKVLKGMDPSEYRYYHSASIFVLGMVIYKNVTILRNKINKFLKSDNYDEFLYSWFLSTFIHDLGYGVVTSDEPYMWNYTDINQISKKTYSILESKLSSVTGSVPKEVRENLLKYKRYKDWRINQNKSQEYIDHGHFSSAVFLEDREARFKKKKLNGEFIHLGNEIYKDKNTGLIWSDNILKDTQIKVGKVIAGHNVFFKRPYENDARVYRREGLEDLLVYEPVYSFDEYPFYFLMQLVDTIDLFKHYSKYYEFGNNTNHQECYLRIFEDIDFEFGENFIRLTFNNFENEFLKIYCREIRSECYWLPIKLKKIRNTVLITFQ